jgi:RimJ/RimL family protein N-acetyltransferase
MAERLTTSRLILRRWREADRAPFQALNVDPRVMEFMPGLLPPGGSDALVDRAELHFERNGFGPFAAELLQNGAFLGFIGLSISRFDAHFMPAVEIGWRLAAEYWGHGLATEGAREVLRYAFEDLGLSGVVSFTSAANTRSRRVMEKLGMTHDPGDDFEHPGLPENHPLRHHVLYRLNRPLEQLPSH